MNLNTRSDTDTGTRGADLIVVNAKFRVSCIAEQKSQFNVHSMWFLKVHFFFCFSPAKLETIPVRVIFEK